MSNAVSKRVVAETNQKHISRLVSAMGDWRLMEPPLPTGTFGRVATLNTENIIINSNDLDFEFVVPFDDDPEVNESEIKVYNLSKHTLGYIRAGKPFSIEAGYKNDKGVIMAGYTSNVVTKHDGVDKVTTIHVLDNKGTKDRSIENVSYSEGTKASYILRDLLNRLNLNIAVFSPRRDHTYKDKVTVDGEIMDSIKKYSEVCGISTYINKGKIYARSLNEGDNIQFDVSVDTGLIGTPEAFEEEVVAEDYKDVVKGYRLKMLLQHRMTTAAIIRLKSLDVSGTFRVRSGKHIFNESEAITEVEVVALS